LAILKFLLKKLDKAL